MIVHAGPYPGDWIMFSPDDAFFWIIPPDKEDELRAYSQWRYLPEPKEPWTGYDFGNPRGTIRPLLPGMLAEEGEMVTLNDISTED